MPKPMPDDTDSEQQLEDEAGADQPQAGEGRSSTWSRLEELNPFEDPELGVLVLLVAAVWLVIGLIGWALGAGAPEIFGGGDPPQGLGLK